MRLRTIPMLGVGGTVALVLLLGSRTIWSYFRTSQKLIREEVEDSVPITFQLKRLEQMVDDLAPEIHRNRVLLAEAEVDVDNLARDVEQKSTELDRQRGQILTRREMLQRSDVQFAIGGRQYDRRQVEQDLAQRLDAYRAIEAAVTSEERLLEARKAVTKAAREKLSNYQRQKRDLEVQVAQLDSQLRLIESMKGSHKIQFNHDKIAEAKRLSEYLKRRLDVAQRVLEDAAEATASIPDDPMPKHDILEEIDAEFGPRQGVAPEPTTPVTATRDSTRGKTAAES